MAARMTDTTSLAVTFAGIPLRTPLVAAAGTCGYAGEMAGVVALDALGAMTTKSITAEPRSGNPPWRILDARHGMLNAIGLANVGLERFLAEKLPEASKLTCVVIGSIAGHSIDEYVRVADAFDAAPALPMVELNVSCPNTSDGLQFGEHPDALSALLREVRPVLGRTRLMVKLSPNVGDIRLMARAAIEGGADALSMVNTFSAMAIDVETRQPRLSRGTGGLSGPAIHPIAVRMVHEVYEHVARPAGIPILGLGGVVSWQDAAEFILAGAHAVGLGTALFVDPRSPKHVARGVRKWVARQGASSVEQLVGRVEL